MTAASTPAARVEAFLLARATLPWRPNLIAWAATADHEERDLTVADLRAVLDELAELRR